MLRPLLPLFAVVVLAGCSELMNGAADMQLTVSHGGSAAPADGTSGTGTDELRCDAPNPGPAPTRRLSHVELRFAIEDLFGDATLARTVTRDLVPDPVSLGFSNSAQLLDVKPVLGQQYMEAAEKVAESVTANLGALLPCNPASAGETACATQFIRELGARAYRRALTQTEVDRYVAGYTSMRQQFDFKTGVEWVVATMLQSPQFLYRAEPNDVAAEKTIAPDGTVIRKVQPHELASRLSFLIWHSVPDQALLAAAEEGKLQTREDVEREARRMMADPRATRFLNFFEEWLDVDKLGKYTRDPSVFPGLPAELPTLFREETRAFVKHVMFEGDAKFSTLMTADFTFANAPLAQHYGISGADSAAFVKVALPPGRRGVWMQGGPLTSHDKATRTSIVNRGLRVRTALLCHNIPSPPDNVDLELGPVDQTASQADRLAEHRTNAACAGCHQLLDPVGQVFENVDAVGRVRTVDEGGRPVVTAGELSTTRDVNGPVEDGAAMMERFANSEQVRNCFASQLFRYAHGREEKPVDACSQKQAYDRFQAHDYDIRELLLGIALSDDFLYRPVEN